MNFLPGMFPVSAMDSRGVPASISLNGVDEVLSRVNATVSPNNILWTYSIWFKATIGASQFARLLMSRLNSSNVTTIFGVGPSGFSPNSALDFEQTLAGSLAQSEVTDADSFSVNGTWHHYVIRYDSANISADNRVIFEGDGSLLNDTTANATDVNESSNILTNGRTLCVCSHPSSFAGFACSVAFVDFIEGQALSASNFAFDDGGVWTRKPYAGSYGAYGFSLDGSDLFNDVSGNGQHFTGTNMDASNLSTSDLPPYTN